MARRRREAAAPPATPRRLWPRSASEQRLIALVRRGDLAAFEILYDRHARELLTFCNYILRSAEDAEDAVQATFASAYRTLIADERKIELRPWLFTIARNASLSILRKRRPTSELREYAAASDDPAARAEQRESLREAVVSLLKLPERQRTALVLAELHGFSHAEIGEVLDISTERVKSYVFQARSSMISERSARDADCAEIRQELAGARGAQLLKGRLRRHLRSCEGCREYSAAIRRRRGQLGVLLPIAPTLALKRRVIDAASSCTNDAGACASGAAGVGAGAATTAELIGVGAKGLVAKLLIGSIGLAAGTGAGSLALGAGGPPRGTTRSTQARGPASVDPAARARNVDRFSTPSTAPGHTVQASLSSRSPRAAASSTTSVLGTARAQRAESADSGAEAHGKSSEAHGKSSEAHGKSSEPHGKSGEAHGNGGLPASGSRGNGGVSSGHGKSAEAHGNGANRSTAHGESSEGHGRSASSRGNASAGSESARPSTPGAARIGGASGEHANSTPAAGTGAGSNGKGGVGAQAPPQSASGEQPAAQPPAQAPTTEGSTPKGQAAHGEPPAQASEGSQSHKP
jgi:RNA polymerase sigma factor (sigma-70 family)